MRDMARGRQRQWSDSSTQAGISCRDCRKRKIKCDRSLPSCSVCLKNAQECIYPVGPLKPGPKIGSSRRRTVRRQSTTQCHCSQSETSPSENQPSPKDDHHHHDHSQSSRRSSNYAGLPSPGTDNPTQPSVEPENLARAPVASTVSGSSSVRLSSLFWILHPSHEPGLDPAAALTPPATILNHDPPLSHSLPSSVEEDVCQALGTTLADVNNLIDLYFSNMTAFSLFHKPTFQKKLASIEAKSDLYALLAAMFAFSSRFCPQRHYPLPDGQSALPTAQGFLDLAYQHTSASLKAYADETPPLAVLQAMVLNTFAELIKGAGSRAWRSVGTCVRIAYECQLHLLDSDSESATAASSFWLVEEQRRAWWTIWEFDVFASTVRRSPTAIDWDTNETLLPIDDESWSTYKSPQSCFLEVDPTLRWKSLQASSNTAAKAWFIVINSIMRNAQVLSSPKAHSHGASSFGNGDVVPNQRPKSERRRRKSPNEIADDLAVLNNSLYCFTVALPRQLRYQNDFLHFGGDSTEGTSRQFDSDVYSIHIMTQLARFMIFREQLSWETEDFAEAFSLGHSEPDRLPNTSEGERRWKRYLDAAEGLVSIVSNSSPDHFQYINPFLGSTIWLGAAILLVHLHLAPSTFPLNRRLTESKVDLLQAIFGKIADWWEMSPLLSDKLSQLQKALQSFGENEANVDQQYHGKSAGQQQLWTNKLQGQLDWDMDQCIVVDPLLSSCDTSGDITKLDSLNESDVGHSGTGPNNGGRPNSEDPPLARCPEAQEHRYPNISMEPLLSLESLAPGPMMEYDSFGIPNTHDDIFSNEAERYNTSENAHERYHAELPDFLYDLLSMNTSF